MACTDTVLSALGCAGGFLYDGTIGAAINSVNWYNSASDSDKRAFWLGVTAAVAVGVLVGVTCIVAACAGLALLAIGVGTGVLGGYAAADVYHAAGGTQGGLQSTMFWGGIAAGAGFAGSYGAGAWAWNKWVVEEPSDLSSTTLPETVYKIGRPGGPWYSSEPMESLRAVDIEWEGHATRPMLWQSTYRISAQFGPNADAVEGPLGATGVQQFRILGEPLAMSTQLYTLPPGLIGAAGMFVGALSSQIPFYA